MKYQITKIKSIKKLGKKTDFVYDIGMKGGNHTFFASDILVHNSIYLHLNNLNNNIHNLSLNEKVKILQDADKEINDKLKIFSKLILKSDNNRLNFKAEKISFTALHIAKKRYGMCVLWNEGFTYTEENTKEKDRIYDENGKFLGSMAITGLDIVRSDFPERFKTFMGNVVKKILSKFPKEKVDEFIIDFRNDLKNVKVDNILFPTGVSDIIKYNAGRNKFQIIKGTPIHVKAGLCYNDLLDHYGINTIAYITNWDKIKWCHLIDNPFKFDVLALKNNDSNPDIIIEYIEKYINYDKMFLSKLQNKLQDFYYALNWGILPDKNTQKINNLFEF